jgi:hypothetical protein
VSNPCPLAPQPVEPLAAALRGLGPVQLGERALVSESLTFSLPEEVR